MPGHDDLFLVNPYGYAFRELTASKLLICDFHGHVLDGEGEPEATAFYIHAEMLRCLLPYARDAGVDVRWVVLREGPEFFAVTKRLHNHLHGPGPIPPRLGEGRRSELDLLRRRSNGRAGRHNNSRRSSSNCAPPRAIVSQTPTSTRHPEARASVASEPTQVGPSPPDLRTQGSDLG